MVTEHVSRWRYMSLDTISQHTHFPLFEDKQFQGGMVCHVPFFRMVTILHIVALSSGFEIWREVGFHHWGYHFTFGCFLRDIWLGMICLLWRFHMQFMLEFGLHHVITKPWATSIWILCMRHLAYNDSF